MIRPCSLAKYAPATPVRITIPSVWPSPMYCPIFIKRANSIIGTPINELRNVKSAIIKAVTISHSGDSRGDDWRSTVMGNWYNTGLPVTNIG